MEIEDGDNRGFGFAFKVANPKGEISREFAMAAEMGGMNAMRSGKRAEIGEERLHEMQAE